MLVLTHGYSYKGHTAFYTANNDVIRRTCSAIPSMVGISEDLFLTHGLYMIVMLTFDHRLLSRYNVAEIGRKYFASKARKNKTLTITYFLSQEIELPAILRNILFRNIFQCVTFLTTYLG